MMIATRHGKHCSYKQKMKQMRDDCNNPSVIAKSMKLADEVKRRNKNSFRRMIAKMEAKNDSSFPK